MKRSCYLLISLLLLSGCAASPEEQQAALLYQQNKQKQNEAVGSQTKQTMDAYHKCVMEAANKYVQSKEDPNYIADAAISKCEVEKHNYVKAMQVYFLSSAGVNSTRSYSMGAEERSNKTRKLLRGQVIQKIVEARMSPQ